MEKEILCGVKISDIDFKNRTCKVLGKRNKERIVMFTGNCAVRINEYLKTRSDIRQTTEGIVCNVDTYLFASNDKEHHAMHRSGVDRVIKIVGKEARISRLHCHLFRTTYATNLAKQGVAIDIIAKLLGHANLNTISRYVLLSDEQMKNALINVGYAA